MLSFIVLGGRQGGDLEAPMAQVAMGKAGEQIA